MKPYFYVSELDYDARPKLFGFAAPGPVRYKALLGLEDRKKKDFLVGHALKDCAKYRPRIELLEDWKSDGTWGIDRLYMRIHGEVAARDMALVKTVRGLYLLKTYCWNGSEDEGYLAETVDAILSRCRDDGSIHFISEKAKWSKGKPASIYSSDHWGGVAVACLLDYGIRDERIDRFFTHLEKTCRDDGGWLAQYYMDSYKGKYDHGDLPSHPLHTWANALALSKSEEHVESELFVNAVKYLLSNLFRSIKFYKKAKASRWERLSDPDFGYSALNLLQLAADAGIGREDDNVDRIFSWLKSMQNKNGLWDVNCRRSSFPDEGLFLALKATICVKRIVDDLGTQ